jgi:hypothetical protein
MDKGKGVMPEDSRMDDIEEMNLSERLEGFQMGYETDFDSDEDRIARRKVKGKSRSFKKHLTRSRSTRRKSTPNLELSLADIHRQLGECETFTPVEETNLFGTGVTSEINLPNLPTSVYPDLTNPLPFDPNLVQPPAVNQGNPEFWWTNDTQFQNLMNAPDGLAPWPYQEPEPNPHWPQVDPADLAEISQFADELSTMGNRLTHMGNVLTWKHHGHNQFGGGQW